MFTNFHTIEAVFAGSDSRRRSVVEVEDGRIRSVTPASADDEVLNAGETLRLLLPGFVDIHNHGAVGVDVNTADEDGLLRVGAYLAANGVTAWLPTLVPDADKNYERVIGEINGAMARQIELPVAQILGIHYEGVFANEKMCGALRPEYFKKFTGGELAALPVPEAGVKMMTFAPEIDGGIELAKELASAGWIASIGHTRASAATLDAAFAANARHVTHFFNAMTGVHHRELGVAGWALTKPDITFDIIADGVHVDARMLELACRVKSPSSVCLISDSISAAGLGDGEFDIWGEKISVANKITRNSRGSIAGSVITMHDAVKQMLRLGFSAGEVSRMASDNPARILGLESARGSIDVGKRADFVVLDAANAVELVMIGGRVVEL